MSAQLAQRRPTGLLLFEWDKARRDRALLLAVLALVLITGAFAALYSWVARSVVDGGAAVPAGEVLSFVIVKGSIAPTIAGLLGAWLGGGDYRRRVWALTLLREPRRGRAFGAKQVVVACVSAAVALVAGVMSVMIAALVVGSGHVFSVTVELVRALVAHLLVTVCWGAIGCSLGVIFRSSLRAVAVLVGVGLLLEPALRLFAMTGSSLPTTISRWLPSSLSAGGQMPAFSARGPALFAEATGAMPAVEALCILGGYVAVSIICAQRAFRNQAV